MAFFTRKDDYLYVRWAREVKIRDHYQCVICGARGVELESHHLNAWASFPDERYDLENGVTLCKAHCHEMFHEIYGKGKNTGEQFEEFERIYGLMIAEAQFQIRVERATGEAIRLIEAQPMVEKVLAEFEDGYGQTKSKVFPVGIGAGGEEDESPDGNCDQTVATAGEGEGQRVSSTPPADGGVESS